MSGERLVLVADPECEDVRHVVLCSPRGVHWYRVDTDDTYERLAEPAADPVARRV